MVNQQVAFLVQYMDVIHSISDLLVLIRGFCSLFYYAANTTRQELVENK